jgi:putative endonuclease
VEPTLILAERPRDPRHRLAEEGEAAAERYLRQAGFRIRHRRFLCRLGELDIVADDGPILVFVEVKTRHDTRFASPWESVTRTKRNRLRRAALVYLQRTRSTHRRCRFDVVEVVGPAGGPFEIHHIRDAFEVG